MELECEVLALGEKGNTQGFTQIPLKRLSFLLTLVPEKSLYRNWVLFRKVHTFPVVLNFPSSDSALQEKTLSDFS